MRILLLLAAAVSTALPAQPATPSPALKWVVNYSPESCEVVRPRIDGQNGLVLRMRPHSSIYELKIIAAPNGRKLSTEEIVLSAPAADSKFPQYAAYGDSSDGKYGLVETTITSEQVARAAADGKLTARGKKMGEVAVSTQGITRAMAAATRCISDLASQWGAPRTWTNDPKAFADLRGLFTASDYPSDLVFARKSGSLRTLLGIDENGRVISCRSIGLVGDKRFADLTCSILRKRARFVPATDATGTAVTSFTLSPRLDWRIL